MGRRPIAISEENARVNTQEGRALKSPPFWTLKPTYGGYFPDFAITYSNFDTSVSTCYASDARPHELSERGRPAARYGAPMMAPHFPCDAPQRAHGTAYPSNANTRGPSPPSAAASDLRVVRRAAISWE